MFTFLEMLAMVVSESSFGAFVYHRRPVRLHRHQRFCRHPVHKSTVQPGAVKYVLWRHWMHLNCMHQWRQRTNFTAPGCIIINVWLWLRDWIVGLLYPSRVVEKVRGTNWKRCRSYNDLPSPCKNFAMTRKAQRFSAVSNQLRSASWYWCECTALLQPCP